MQSATAYTDLTDPAAAGQALGRQIRSTLHGSPDAIMVFAAPSYAHARLLEAIREEHPLALLVGSSSAGEFTHEQHGQGAACALALKSDHVHFAIGVGRDLHASPMLAARQIVSTFRGAERPTLHRAALVLTDALAGHAPSLIHELMIATDAQYQFFGGGAGDNAQFVRTVVFNGTEVLSDAAVALEILSPRPLGVGVGHGWAAAAEALRVTDAEGLKLKSLNGFPAVQAFEAHAEVTGQSFDPQAPLTFFLHNILGIETPTGHQLRMPLSVDATGAVQCAAEVPTGSRVRIMRSTLEASLQAAERATAAALANLGGQPPGVALFFDCAATRARIGDAYTMELEAVRSTLPAIPMIGCVTHGQIARSDGQFDGFHNCTALVCVLPA